MKQKVFTTAYYFLGFITGVFFILSGISKLYPIEPFEFTFVEVGAASWENSLILARIVIGLELICGILLILQFAYKKFTLPFVWVLLAIFSIYLVYQLSIYGNTGNCGCFGDAVQMTPLEGLLKNAGLLFISIILYFTAQFKISIKIHRAVRIGLLILFTLSGSALPFILNPVEYPVSQEVYGRERSFTLNLDTLYSNPLNPPPTIELRNGKWIIAFMSLTCPHCRTAAKKLHVIKAKNPNIPIHLVLNGKDADMKAFFDDTRAENLSWSRLNGPKLFSGLAGNELPQIYWVDKSVVVNESNVYTLYQNEIEAWLAKP